MYSAALMCYSNILQSPHVTRIYIFTSTGNGINDTFGMGTIVLMSENVQTITQKMYNPLS